MVCGGIERSSGWFGLVGTFELQAFLRLSPFFFAPLFGSFARRREDAAAEHEWAPLRHGGDGGGAIDGRRYFHWRGEEVSQRRVCFDICLRRSAAAGVFRDSHMRRGLRRAGRRE
jgi:hypothetical protein